MYFTITAKEAGRELSYEDVIERAGYDRTRVLTVVYQGKRNGDLRRSGCLYPGKSVTVDEGMVFSVADTSNA